MNNINTSKFDRLDLNLLRIFNLIYEQGSISRVSEILCVSQSAVSHALNRLRSYLNDPLFFREGRRIHPTPFAKEIAPQIAYHLIQLNQLLSQTQAFDPKKDLKQVTIAMTDELETPILPNIIEQARKHELEIDFVSTKPDYGSMLSDLASGKIDLWLDTPLPSIERLSTQLIVEDPFCVVSRQGVPKITMENYLDAKHVAVMTHHSLQTVEDQMLRQINVHRKIVVRCQRFRAATQIAINQDYLLTMPLYGAYFLSVNIPVQIHPLPFTLPAFPLYAYWHQQNDHNPATQWIFNLVKQALILSIVQVKRQAMENAKT